MKGSLKPGSLKLPNFKLNRFKLTREMKLALTGVALIGAVGGWYTWNTAHTPEIVEGAAPSANAPASAESAAQSAPPADAGTSAPTIAAAPTQAAPTQDQGRVTIVRPKNPVKVEQIPFLTAHAPQESAAKPAPAVAAAPQQDTLSNPFRPFEVQASAQQSAPPSGQASAPALSVPPVSAAPRAPLIASVPNVPTAGLSPTERARAVAGSFSGNVGGGLSASPPIVLTPPKISGAVPFPRVRPTSRPVAPNVPKPNLPTIVKAPSAPGAIGVPSISGAVQVPSASTAPSIPSAPPIALRAPDVVPLPPVATVPVPTVPGVSAGTPLPLSGATGAVPTLASAPAVSVPAVPIPGEPRVKPPTPTLSVPGTVSVSTLAAPPAQAAPAPDASPESVPPMLAQLETPADQTPQAAPVSPLEAFVQDQDLTFSAAVLGPVNTGILNAKSGYLVVTVGQTLQGSEVVVRDITATSVTLALGDEQKILELNRADAPDNQENATPSGAKPQNPADGPTSGEVESPQDANFSGAAPAATTSEAPTQEAPTAQASDATAPVGAVPAAPASPDLTRVEPPPAAIHGTTAEDTDAHADAAALLPAAILASSIPATPIAEASPSAASVSAASEPAATDPTPANPTDDPAKGEP